MLIHQWTFDDKGGAGLPPVGGAATGYLYDKVTGVLGSNIGSFTLKTEGGAQRNCFESLGQVTRYFRSNRSFEFTDLDCVWSIACWVWIDPGMDWAAKNGISMILGNGTTFNGCAGLGVGSTEGTFTFYLRTNSGVGNAATSPASYSTKAVWHHLVGVYDGLNKHSYLYVDGVYVAEDTSVTGDNFDGTNWTCGGGYTMGGGSTNYRFAGRIDDARVYTGMLDQAEITWLAKGCIGDWRLNGNPYDYSDQGNNLTYFSGYDWTLEDETGVMSYESDTTNYLDSNDSGIADNQNLTVSAWFRGDSYASNSGVCGNRSGSNGWMLYRNTGNPTNYYGFIMYYATSSNTYGQTLAPTGEWHHFVMTRDENGYYAYYHNGVKYQEATISGAWRAGVDFLIGDGGDGSYRLDGKIGSVQLFGRRFSDAECQALYHERAYLGKYGGFTGLVHQWNFHDTSSGVVYGDWQTDIGGSTATLIENGSGMNTRQGNGDPWTSGGTGLSNGLLNAWRGLSTGVNSAEGGWNQNIWVADKTKKYRYSVWIYSNSTTCTKYFGCHNSGTASVQTLAGVAQTNPYFWYGDPPAINTWYLMVAFIYPHTHTGTVRSLQTGFYNSSGTYVAALTQDFKWRNITTVYHRHRTYQYYCTASGISTYWWFPRIDLMDGSEPSINELVKGIDLENYWYNVKKVSVPQADPNWFGKQGAVLNKFRNCGNGQDALVWLPLNGNYVSYGRQQFTASGINANWRAAPGNSCCVDLNGTNAYIDLPTISLGTQWTAMGWYNMDDFLGYGHLLTADAQTTFAWKIAVDGSSIPRKMYWYSSATGSLASNTTLSPNTWYHLAVTNSGGTLRFYVNGVQEANTYTVNTTISATAMKIGNYAAEWSDMRVRDVRIFRKQVTQQEIQMIYELTGGDFEKRMIVKGDKVYSRGGVLFRPNQ